LSDQFTCSICGETHEGLPTDRAFALPDVVWDIPEAERAERAKFDSDLCRFGERHFIRCVLRDPFAEAEGEFTWGVWAEVERSVFRRYLEIYSEDGSSEPLHRGTLANSLPPYERSAGSAVLVQFGTATQRPSLSLGADDGSTLAQEQRHGIDNARYHQILDVIEGGASGS
jgi:hypothetical protein